MTEKRCFFGSRYTGKNCVCGWEEKMIKTVPRGYIKDNGCVKFYVTNNYKHGATTYKWERSKQHKSQGSPPRPKYGRFLIYDNYRVKPRGEWSETMVNYLNNVLVKKEGKNLTCIGVVNKQKHCMLKYRINSFILN
jgi:hypothetical protein